MVPRGITPGECYRISALHKVSYFWPFLLPRPLDEWPVIKERLILKKLGRVFSTVVENTSKVSFYKIASEASNIIFTPCYRVKIYFYPTLLGRKSIFTPFYWDYKKTRILMTIQMRYFWLFLPTVMLSTHKYFFSFACVNVCSCQKQLHCQLVYPTIA